MSKIDIGLINGGNGKEKQEVGIKERGGRGCSGFVNVLEDVDLNALSNHVVKICLSPMKTFDHDLTSLISPVGH